MPSSATYCVDAAVVVRRFLLDYPAVHDLWADFRRTKARLVAPHLLRYEVANAFHKMRRAGALSAEAAERQLAVALELEIDFHGEVDLHVDAAEIAVRHRLPATYDAHYLALAQRLGVDFFTTDARLAKAVGDDLPWVRLVR